MVLKKNNVPNENESYSTERIKELTMSRIHSSANIVMTRRPIKHLGAMLFAAALIAVSAVTVFAFTYKRPAEVAEELHAPVLAEMFEEAAVSEAKAAETLSENGETTEVIKQADINESITSGKYTYTLLGILTSDETAEYQTIGSEGKSNTYVVVAIANADGTFFDKETYYDPKSDSDNFSVTPLLTGIAPRDRGVFWNGGATENIIDGVIYRILSTDDLEIFADKGVKLVVHTETWVDNNAYYYDEEIQDYVLNKDFEGSAVMFDLPLDKSKGDPEKVAQYFADQKAEEENPTPLPPEIQAQMDAMKPAQEDAANIDWTDAIAVKEVSGTFTPDADGLIKFNIYSDEIGGTGGTVRVSDIFPDGKPATIIYGGTSLGAKSPEDVTFSATRYTLNEDGTVTIEMVSPNVKYNPHIAKYPAYSDSAE
jgi:hypothetical protein